MFYKSFYFQLSLDSMLLCIYLWNLLATARYRGIKRHFFLPHISGMQSWRQLRPIERSQSLLWCIIKITTFKDWQSYLLTGMTLILSCTCNRSPPLMITLNNTCNHKDRQIMIVNISSLFYTFKHLYYSEPFWTFNFLCIYVNFFSI